MILAPLLALSLVTTAAIDSAAIEPTQPSAHLSTQQKNNAMEPLVRSATECILKVVVTDPRVQPALQPAEIGDVIVDSMPKCGDAMRAMIAAHDRLFGEGTGETFFSGPYLDMLPTIVFKSVTAASGN